MQALAVSLSIWLATMVDILLSTAATAAAIVVLEGDKSILDFAILFDIHGVDISLQGTNNTPYTHKTTGENCAT